MDSISTMIDGLSAQWLPGFPLGAVPYVLGATILIYLAPALIAMAQGKYDTLNVWIVTVLTGWTVVGWILALLYSIRPGTECLSGEWDTRAKIKGGAKSICNHSGGIKRWPFWLNRKREL